MATISGLNLTVVDGIAKVLDAHYILLPGEFGDQVTAVYLTVAGSAAAGKLEWSAPAEAQECELAMGLCDRIIGCFPHTEMVVGSLHSDPIDSDDSADEAGPAAARQSSGTLQAPLRTFGGSLKSDGAHNTVLSHFTGCAVGEKFKIFFALRHPRVEALHQLKRTFATGSLSRIVEPSNTLADVTPRPPFVAELDVLRSRKFLAMYLGDSHVIPLE